MVNNICILYANCIPVKGATKSIICDLQRQNYIYIPNDLYDILLNHKGKSIQEIKDFYENKYDEIIENYFQILLTNEFAFLTDTPELFPAIQMEWSEPFEITNAIIDLGLESKFDLKNILMQLSNLNCKFIQIRYFKHISNAEIEGLFKYLNSIKSNSIGIELLIPFSALWNEKDYINLFKNYKRLNTLIIHSSPKEKEIKTLGHSRYYINTGVCITSEKHCGFIDKSLFSINIKTFTEALKFNSCLNGKIAINQFGEIKNCPSMPQAFGNVQDVLLKDALLEKYFKKYWKLNKDDIEVCKDCEFRYICTDCRAYLDSPKNDKSKPLKCGYNPYKGEWEDWSTSKLKKKAKSHYNI